MITMSQPSIVLHAEDVPGYRYRMWETWVVPKTLPVPSIVNLISCAVDRSPEQRINNVIFNSHGLPGKIFMGTGIDKNTVGLFSKLKNKDIGTIWIVACLVGATQYKNYKDNGPAFCFSLSKNIGADVVAANEIQSVGLGVEIYARLPFTGSGYIDDFEGILPRYDPAGQKKIIGNNGAGLYE